MYRTSQYTQYETLEISKLPLTIPPEHVQQTIMKIVNAIRPKGTDKLTDDYVQACHRRQGWHKEHVLLKLLRRGDARKIMQQRHKLRNLDLKKIDARLTGSVYINEHLCPYYSKLAYCCKKLYEAELIYSFWTSGHKLKLQLVKDGDTKILTHATDFQKLLPNEDLSPIDGIM